MKAFVIYNKDSPARRVAEDLSKRLEEAQVDSELVDADSPYGIQLAESHDIMGRPAVALTRADGTVVQIWQGEDGLPMVSEVSYLAHQ